MNRIWIALAAAVLASLPLSAASTGNGSREFHVSPGGKLRLDLDAGGSVKISGSGGSSVVVAYTLSCKPDCSIDFAEDQGGVKVTTEFTQRGKSHSADIDLDIQVPKSFDVQIDSMGGDVSIQGVEGTFSGKTMGGDLDLRDVRGTASLETMGGRIDLHDAHLDGSLKTMGGQVLFENVEGSVRGSSMGGNVRYKNVRRSDGKAEAPPHLDAGAGATSDTVQISTMGGEINVDDAPAGADVMTMGGNIVINDARRFVRAKTMGGDINLASVDGSVKATTMGGDIDAKLVGGGGEVDLQSMSGDVALTVPRGFGMQLDLEIAITKNSSQEYKIEAPGGIAPTVTPEWDHGQGSPRKYTRVQGAANGGGDKVKIRTVNGNITVTEEGRPKERL